MDASEKRILKLQLNTRNQQLVFAMNEEKRSHTQLTDLIKRKLEEQGFTITPEGVVYGGKKVDILAKKGDKTHVIEIKTNRKAIIKWLSASSKIRSLPYVDYVSVAAPADKLANDVLEFAGRMRISVIAVAEDEIVWKVKDVILQSAHLNVSISRPSQVSCGQTFIVRMDILGDGGKTAYNARVDCILFAPFRLLEGERNWKRVKQLRWGETITFEFKICVDRQARPGIYAIFLKWSAEGIPVEGTYYDIEVKPESEETLRADITSVIDYVNQSSSKLVGVLNKIGSAALKGTIDVKEQVIDKSIWNDLGSYFFVNGFFKYAEMVYNGMLETLRKYEAENKLRLHEGLALYNLGIALYSQGKVEEARKVIAEAYEQDKVTFGIEQAEQCPAKKALAQLFPKEPIPLEGKSNA